MKPETLLKCHATKYCTYMSRVPHCLSTRPNWDSPTPSPPSESVLPPGAKRGGTHSPAGEGVGECQFGRLEKKPSTLSTLCVTPRNQQFCDDLSFLFEVKVKLTDALNSQLHVSFNGMTDSECEVRWIRKKSPRSKKIA
jgi:hypothetical protein